MNELRLIIAGVMWLGYLVFLWLALSTIGVWSILLALVLMIPLLVLSSMLFREKGDSPMQMTISAFNSNQANAESEKRKRERIDNVLRDMSTEDLEALKQRLSDGVIDDAILEERIVGIGDDGELITRSGRENRSDKI